MAVIKHPRSVANQDDNDKKNKKDDNLYLKRSQFYSNRRVTMTLEGIARGCDSFEEFERECTDDFLNDDMRVGEYLFYLLSKYEKKASVVSIDAMLASSYVGNIMNGKKNNPSRNVLICIAFAIGLDVEETQLLLKYAGHAPLYVRKKRDVVIWFGLTKKETLDNINEMLIEKGFQPLYKN